MPIKPFNKRTAALIRATLIAGFLFGTNAQIANGVEFEIKGTASMTGFTPEGKVDGVQVLNFSLQVSNSLYKVRLTGFPENFIDYRESAYDGQYLYLIDSLAGSIAAAKTAGKQLAGKNTATGWIYKDQHVVRDVIGSQMGPIWLMFASGEYFKSLTNNLVEPAVVLGLYIPSLSVTRQIRPRALWHLQEDPPNFPVEVSYFDDGTIYLPPPRKPIKRLPPYENGFTNAIFKVINFTNVGGLQIPNVGVLETFHPRDGLTGTGELYCASRYEISVKSVKLGLPPTVFRPEFPGVTAISDVRFYDRAAAVTYLQSGDSAWLPEQVITNKEAFKRKAAITDLQHKKQLEEESQMPNQRRVIIVIMLALIVVAPIALIITKLKNTDNRKKG